MTLLRQVALSCCIVSTLAGIIRIFWPENSFKKVINTVLVLYIITAALQLPRQADWQGIAAEIKSWLITAEVPDYSRYMEEFLMEESGQ